MLAAVLAAVLAPAGVVEGELEAVSSMPLWVSSARLVAQAVR